jgi:hypothetical protein
MDHKSIVRTRETARTSGKYTLAMHKPTDLPWSIQPKLLDTIAYLAVSHCKNPRPAEQLMRVPQTPHAPTFINAAFFGIFGHG